MPFPYQKLSVIILLTIGVLVLRENDLSPSSILPESFQGIQPRQLLQTEDRFLNNYCSASNLKISTTYSPSQISLANRSHSFVEMIRGSNPLIKIINERDLKLIKERTHHNPSPRENQHAISDQYTRSMIPIMIVMWVFFAIALYCYWGFLCASRGVGKRIFRAFHRKGLTFKKKRVDKCSLFLVLVLIGLGVSGAIISGNIESDTDKAICTWHDFMEDAIQGSPEDNWLGMIPISNSFALLNNFMHALEIDITDMKWRGHHSMDSYSRYIQQVANASIHYNRLLLPRANTYDENRYLPDFIESFAPLNNSHTIVTKLVSEFNDHFYRIKHAISNIYRDFHLKFQINKTNLTTTLRHAKVITDEAFVSAQNILELSHTYSHQLSSTTKSSQSLLKLTFTLVICVSIFCLLWWVLTVALKTRVVNCLNLGWWLLSGLSMLGWIVSLISIPTNIGLMESCGALNKALEQPEFFNKTMSLFVDYASSMNNYLYTCVHGNADIPLSFGLIKPTKVFTEAYNIEVLESLGVLSSQSPTKSKMLPNIFTYMEEYHQGLKPDSQETVEDLQMLNKNSHSWSSCTPMQDTWVLNSTFCKSNTEKIFSANDPADFNVGKPTCIGFDQWNKTQIHSITKRYQALKLLHGCNGEGFEEDANLVQKLVNGFLKNRLELGMTIEGIEKNLDKMEQRFEEHIVHLNGFSSYAKEIGHDLMSLNETLFSPKEGVMNNMKCPILQKNLKDFHENLCIGLIPTIFQISVIILVFSVFSMITAGSLFYLSRNIRDYNLKYAKLGQDESLIDSPYQKIDLEDMGSEDTTFIRGKAEMLDDSLDK